MRRKWQETVKDVRAAWNYDVVEFDDGTSCAGWRWRETLARAYDTGEQAGYFGIWSPPKYVPHRSLMDAYYAGFQVGRRKAAGRHDTSVNPYSRRNPIVKHPNTGQPMCYDCRSVGPKHMYGCPDSGLPFVFKSVVEKKPDEEENSTQVWSPPPDVCPECNVDRYHGWCLNENCPKHDLDTEITVHAGAVSGSQWAGEEGREITEYVGDFVGRIRQKERLLRLLASINNSNPKAVSVTSVDFDGECLRVGAVDEYLGQFDPDSANYPEDLSVRWDGEPVHEPGDPEINNINDKSDGRNHVTYLDPNDDPNRRYYYLIHEITWCIEAD